MVLNVYAFSSLAVRLVMLEFVFVTRKSGDLQKKSLSTEIVNGLQENVISSKNKVIAFIAVTYNADRRIWSKGRELRGPD